MLTLINLIDFAILIAVIFAAGNGHRRGFWLSLFQYLGLLGGVLLGAAVAPALADLLGINNPIARPLTAVIVLLALGSLGSSIGYWLGEAIRARIVPSSTRGELDNVTGALFSMAAVLVVCWFLGLSFSRGPSPAASRLIQRSAILRFLDGYAPRPPSFLAGVQQVLSGVSFPATFSGLEPILGAPPPPDPGRYPWCRAGSAGHGRDPEHRRRLQRHHHRLGLPDPSEPDPDQRPRRRRDPEHGGDHPRRQAAGGDGRPLRRRDRRRRPQRAGAQPVAATAGRSGPGNPGCRDRLPGRAEPHGVPGGRG